MSRLTPEELQARWSELAAVAVTRESCAAIEAITAHIQFLESCLDIACTNLKAADDYRPRA